MKDYLRWIRCSRNIINEGLNKGKCFNNDELDDFIYKC